MLSGDLAEDGNLKVGYEVAHDFNADSTTLETLGVDMDTWRIGLGQAVVTSSDGSIADGKNDCDMFGATLLREST